MTATSGPGVPVTHVAQPLPDTAYTIGGPRDGRLLDMRYGTCWPAEGICTCGMVVRRDAVDEPWDHTGRMPGAAFDPVPRDVPLADGLPGELG